tara:strand:- start:224 stop:601 length:378 start_codon:yes stop_codon:yes gene_type:complete
MEWNYSNFKPEEFACQHCGKEGISPNLLDKLQEFRTYLGFPFVVTSGYRCLEHPIEAKKTKAGVHASGLAVDILCRGEQAYIILANAAKFGFTGIGVNQKGNSRFIHLDISEPENDRPRPHVWSY